MTVALQAVALGILVGAIQFGTYIGLNLMHGEKWNEGL